MSFNFAVPISGDYGIRAGTKKDGV